MTELRELLKGSNTPLEWILAPEENNQETNDDLIKKFSIKPLLEKSHSRDKFFENCMLSDSSKRLLESATRGQSNSTVWLSLRQYRLTASNFGIIIRAIEKNSYPKSLIKRLLGMIFIYT